MNFLFIKENFFKLFKNRELPIIKADVFISLGPACRPAYWLTKAGLRKYSLPFDWMMGYNLDIVIDTLKHPQNDWFTNFSSEPGKYNHRVTDNATKMISLHHFPQDCSVKDYLPKFNEVFKRRKERFCSCLENNKNICFVMNRTDKIKDILFFMKQIHRMYPKNFFTIVNVRQDNVKKDVIKYKKNKCIVFDVYYNDINENGSDQTNPNFWIGNTKFWEDLTKKFYLTNV